MCGVCPEWRLVKAQNFSGEALASAGVGRGEEDDPAGYALHLLNDFPKCAFVGHRFLHRFKLRLTQCHTHGL